MQPIVSSQPKRQLSQPCSASRPGPSRQRQQPWPWHRPRLAILLLVCLSAACRNRGPKAVHVPEMSQGFDASSIDATELATHAPSRHHVLNMGLPELNHRLGSFALRTQTTIALSQDGRPLGQKVHTSVWVRDEAGNTHLQAGNADHQFEMVAFGDKAYVRQDRGHMRRKRRQEVDELELAEAAVGNLREHLQHFAGATLVRGAATTWEGKEASRYEVELGSLPGVDAIVQPSLILLPVAAPSRWREEAKHPMLSGKVVVDHATGAVVKADVSGSLTVTASTGRPIVVSLRCVHTISEIGTVTAVREPTQSIPEVRRPLRPRDPLSFFREAQKGHETAAKSGQSEAQGPKSGLGEPVGESPDGQPAPDEDLPDDER